MWNTLPTSYDPFSTPMSYGLTEVGLDVPEEHAHRTVDPIENPGQSRLAQLRQAARREYQSMPFVDDACSVCLDYDYVQEHVLRKDLSSEDQEAIVQQSWSTSTKVALVAMIVLLTSCGLLALAEEKDIWAYSKIFRVPKGTHHWRIIADSRIAGRLCRAPPPVNFPNIRTLLTEIALLGATFAVVGDFKFWFYQHSVNPGLQRMFGIKCGKMHRMLRCLPMGWPHSPRYAQCIAWGIILHREIGQDSLGVYEKWGKDPPHFVRLREYPEGPTVGLIFLWLDNVMVICKNPKLRDDWYTRLALNAGKLPDGVKDGDVDEKGVVIQRDAFNVRWKNLDKTDRPCYLGIHFRTCPKGVYWSHEADRIVKWRIPVAAPVITPRDAARLTGISIWHQTITMEPMYDIKPVIDVMKRISPHVTCKSHWDIPLEKLGCPLTDAEVTLLRQQVHHALKNPRCGIELQNITYTMYAVSDACKEDQSEPSKVSGVRVMKRPQAEVNGAGAILFGETVEDFQPMSHRWSDEERLLDIHILELMAVLETVKWIPPQSQLTRLILGCDNTVAVSVLTKFYSSCDICCALAKDILRICASKNLYLHVMWVPGVENAADPPSRGAPPNLALNRRSWEILHGAPPHTQRIGRRSSDHPNLDDSAEDFEMGMKRLCTK